MTWPSSVIVDAIFIPIYLALTALSVFDVVRQPKGMRASFVYLVIFSIVRLVANVLLVYAYHDQYKNTYVTVWGFILQGLGYSFLISATLGLTSRGMQDPYSDPSFKEMIVGEKGKQRAPKLLNIANVVALILLIIGYNESTGAFPGVDGNNSSGQNLNGLVKVGDAIYVVLTPIMFLFAALSLARAHYPEQRLIFRTIMFALVFMAVRAGYVAYLVFTNRVFTAPLVPKLILQYVMEVCAVVIYGILGIVLRH